MRVCNHCGKPLRTDSRFCPFCGVAADPALIARQAGLVSGRQGQDNVSPHAKYARTVGALFFVPFSFIAAVVLATIALSRIAQSDGELEGRDMALTGIFFALGSTIFQGILLYFLASTGILPLSIPQHLKINPNASPEFVENEMRVVAMALERHRDSHYIYPKPSQYSDDLPSEVYLYLRRPYLDPYQTGGTRAYRYNASEGEWWLLASVGPDMEPDIDVSLYEGKPELYPGQSLTYDPTNGALSPGDIWLSGPFNDYNWFGEP